jgi:hypothetical protein
VHGASETLLVEATDGLGVDVHDQLDRFPRGRARGVTNVGEELLR